MRVLLINSNRLHQPWPVIPIGVCAVASALDAAKHKVQVLDLCFQADPALAIRAAIAAFSPDLVGVSIRNLDNATGFETRFLIDDVAADVIAPLRAAFRGPIVIGGPAVGVSAADLLEHFDLELAIRGDGELALLELARRLETGEPLPGMAGLVLRRQGRVLQDSAPHAVEDLDALPFASPQLWIDLAPYRRYGSPLQMQTKRGCALACTYCTYNLIEGRRWRLRSPERVADEIEDLIRATGIRDVEFTDSTFNLPLTHAKAVLRAIRDRGLACRLRTMGLNPGAIDEELADLLAATGFSEVHLGAESGCDATLRALGKSYKAAAVVRAGHLLRARGIAIKWDVLVGAPNETLETLRTTFATLAAAASPWDLIDVGVGIRAYRGAPVATEMAATGRVDPGENFLRPVAVEPAAVSLREIRLLTRREALRRCNVFMYGEDERTPLWLLAAVTWLMRRCAPRQPLFRAFIVLRLLQRWTGINWLRRLGFGIAHGRALRALEQRGTVPVRTADPGPPELSRDETLRLPAPGPAAALRRRTRRHPARLLADVGRRLARPARGPGVA